MKPFTLTCLESNTRHTKFNVFDPTGANCGTLTILTDDVVGFIQRSWKGNINWDGKMPDDDAHPYANHRRTLNRPI
jgi:hypothetical protein